MYATYEFTRGQFFKLPLLGIFYKVIHKTATFYKHIPSDLFLAHTNGQSKQCTRNLNILQPPPPQQKYENQSLISEA